MEEENNKETIEEENSELDKEETAEETEEKSEETEASEKKEVDRFNREMHKAICSDCKKECEVPFKPSEGRPIYCKDCYRKHVPQRRY